MKILFVQPIPERRHQLRRYQQGLGFLSAALKAAGHRTALLLLTGPDRAAWAAAREREKPDLAALSFTSNHQETARAVAAWAGEEELPLIAGGVHATVCPEETIAWPGVAALCRGEGEAALAEYCAALESGRDPGAIANLWVKRADGSVRRNPLRPLVRDLDALPFPDRELFPYDEMIAEYPEAEFLGSRGCPYLCGYCVNHSLVELHRGLGPFVRFRSVDNLLAEIERVVQRYPKTEIVGFHDDTFTLRPSWLAELADKYPARIGLPFWCNSTAGRVTGETVALLKRAGCYEVRLGVETGDDRLRREMLNKKATTADIERAFALLREAGLRRYAFNMVGIPGETTASLQATLELNQRLRPDSVFCSFFYPYPGTRARALCEERGWLTERSVSSFFEKEYCLEQPGVTREEVIRAQDLFADLVRRPRLAWWIRFLARVPVGRGRTLWNAWRRLKAWGVQLRQRFRRG